MKKFSLRTFGNDHQKLRKKWKTEEEEEEKNKDC